MKIRNKFWNFKGISKNKTRAIYRELLPQNMSLST